jgi:hypothetical protein
VQSPRTQHEEDFLEFRWRPDGLLQWAVVQGRWQTAARAEDMAVLAGLLGPEPAGLASDNAASVTFLQRMSRGEGMAANSRQANGDVREAIARLVACRGISGCCAFKVKAHTTEAQEGLGLVTTSEFRKHNEVADQAAKAAVLQHPAPLRGFIRVMTGRGKMYIRFLQELAKLFVRIARAVEAAYEGCRRPPCFDLWPKADGPGGSGDPGHQGLRTGARAAFAAWLWPPPAFAVVGSDEVSGKPPGFLGGLGVRRQRKG